MIGKRTNRVYTQKCGIQSNKQQKLDHQQQDGAGSQITTLSKCFSPEDRINPSDNQISTDEASAVQEKQQSSFSKNDLVCEMLKLLIDEFNCNHQADLDQDNGVEIFSRDKEQKFIRKFVSENIDKKKSSLLYLCGHPGTGKTSTLNYVLNNMINTIKNNLLSQLNIFMFNAMSYRDVKSFSIQLLEEVTQRLTGEPISEKIKKHEIDDEDLSNMIAKALKTNLNMTKIIVIDEIDAFEAHEKAFLTMTKAILNSKTNTVLIGIANSVDLPFKKKHSAIALRDSQLLFEPYSEEQIGSIIEEKVNLKYAKFPMRLKDAQIRGIFFNLIDDKALNIISKRVSKMNGDVRVAFDIIKSCFLALFAKVKQSKDILPDKEMVVTLDMVLKVFEEKYGSKLAETLKNLPRQNIIVLEAITNLFADVGEDKKLSFHEVIDEVERICKQRGMIEVMRSGSLLNFMEELAFYNIILIERNKKEIKTSKFSLKVELEQLSREMQKIIKRQEGKQTKEEEAEEEE